MNLNPDPTLRKVSTTTTMSAPPRERRWWTSSEDEVLQNKAQVQMDRYGSVKNWNEIAALLPYRTNKDCRKRWYKVRRDIRKGAWMPEEDKKLEEAVAQVGLKWSTVARIMQTRNADQCAKRWQHVLGPDFKHAPWTPEEDKILQEAIAKYGNNWKQLGLSELPDRSTHDIRNRSVTLSRRNGRMAGNTTQKSLQAPSPSPSTPSSEADSSSSRSGSLQSSSSSCSMLLDADSDLTKTNNTIPTPTSNPCWSTAPSALLDPTMDSPFFTACGWGVSPSDVLDPTHTSLSHHPQPQHPHHQSLRTDFDPWLHQLGAAAATPTSHAPQQQQQLHTSGPHTTGLQTPESEPFLLSEPGSHDPDPLDALCFLDDPMPVDDGTVGGGEMIFKTETCGSNSSDDSVDLKILRSPYGDDSGLGSSPDPMSLEGGLGAAANVATMGGVTTTTTASATNGRKGSVTVLLRQSDSHLTSDVVRGLMGLDVDLTIRVVRD